MRASADDAQRAGSTEAKTVSPARQRRGGSAPSQEGHLARQQVPGLVLRMGVQRRGGAARGDLLQHGDAAARVGGRERHAGGDAVDPARAYHHRCLQVAVVTSTRSSWMITHSSWLIPPVAGVPTTISSDSDMPGVDQAPARPR